MSEFTELDDPMLSGKGKLCASVVNGVHQDVVFILKYEDNDVDDMIFTDRDVARKSFACAENRGWNCHLFEQMPRKESDSEAKIKSLEAEITALKQSRNDVDDVLLKAAFSMAYEHDTYDFEQWCLLVRRAEAALRTALKDSN